MIQPVTRIQPTPRINRTTPHKITALPPRTATVRRRTLWQIVSPYLIIVAFIFAVSLLNGIIGE